MIFYYLKTAFRNLVHQRIFTPLNILGLSIGLACSLIILLHVKYELDYDLFHTKKDRIARVLTNDNAYTPYILASSLIDYYPEIEAVTQVTKFSALKCYILQKEKLIEEKEIIYADSSFFNIFSFSAIDGNPHKMLRSPDKLMISENISKKYFGSENPSGKLISLRISNITYDFTVEGVYQDFPKQSHFHANLILPIDFFTKNQLKKSSLKNWRNNCVLTYILVKQPGMINRIGDKLPDLIAKYIPKDRAKGLKFSVQSLADIHLYSNELEMDIEPQGSITRVIVFSSIAFLVLIIALVNFVLLSMALSFQRIKEFGIRKVNGALSGGLVLQIVAEFIIVFFIAFGFALLIVKIIAPLVENQMSLRISTGIRGNIGLIFPFIAAVILLGYFASSFIARSASRYNPMDALNNTISIYKTKVPSRGIMIIFQFSIMICLISCLMIVQKQLYLLKNKDLGFRKDQLVIVDIPRNAYKNYVRFKSELAKIASVKSVSGAAYLPPSDETWSFDLKNPETGESFLVEEINADYGFVETMGIELLEGRSFSPEFANDSISILINETGLRTMGIINPLETVMIGPDYYPNRSKLAIIGVFKDFHIHSLYNKITPMAIILAPERAAQMSIKMDPKFIGSNLNLFEEKWKSVFPNDPFRYSFVDEFINQRYMKEDQNQAMIGLFALLSIVIALLGLFGISTFAIQRRTKEIGLRKVNGAHTIQVVVMLNKDFVSYVALAFVIATPVAWYAMHRWLENFAYKTELSWWIFALAGLLALGIALLTVSWQSWKAATRNPVESLRYE